MAITATLGLSESKGGVGAALMKNLVDVYTILHLDYTIERTCDRLGRPSSSPSITFIKVTIRATKEKNTPFHDWINTHDKLMNGEIKIFDSSGMLSSTVQDATGMTDTLIDIDKAVDVPTDMMDDAIKKKMDDVSKYDTRELDVFDEMSHEDLMKYAFENGISVTNKDSDDDIREKIRKAKAAKEVDNMSLEQLKQYATDNGLEVPTGASEDVLRKLVMADKDAKIEKDRNKDDNRIYKAAESYKKQTVNTAKAIVKGGVARRVLECARCISFEDAYCVSLREEFYNNAKDLILFDTSYPWTLEVGIKPQKVTVYGEQLAGVSIGKSTEFNFF